MNSQDKIIPVENIGFLKDRLKDQKIVFTNGCFDIIHKGHVSYLQEAKLLGQVLVVALNSDESVKKIKGPTRPINNEEDRAFVLAGLQSVDKIVIFNEKNVLNLLSILKPDIYVKGGDYTIDTIDQTERDLVESWGGQIKILSGVKNKSTTSTIDKILKLAR